MRKTLSCIAGAALVVAPWLQNQKPIDGPLKPKTPRQTEKERIERELQGVWEVSECTNPQLFPILRSSGFMFIHDGWMSVNIVITTQNRTNNAWQYHIVGATKRYTVTETNRLRLEDLWGFSNPGGLLEPDVAGTVEERTLQFIGAPEIGQKLRIARGAGDSVSFVRRSLPPRPSVTATGTEK